MANQSSLAAPLPHHHRFWPGLPSGLLVVGLGILIGALPSLIDSALGVDRYDALAIAALLCCVAVVATSIVKARLGVIALFGTLPLMHTGSPFASLWLGWALVNPEIIAIVIVSIVALLDAAIHQRVGGRATTDLALTLIAFGAVGLLPSLWAIDRPAAVLGDQLGLLIPILLYLGLLSTADGEDGLDFVVRVIAVGGLASCAFAVSEIIRAGDPLLAARARFYATYADGVRPVTGGWSEPLALGVILAWLAPLFVAKALSSRSMFWTAMSALTIGTVVYTISRGPLAVLIAELIVLFFVSWRMRLLQQSTARPVIVALVGCLGIMGAVFGYYFYQRITGDQLLLGEMSSPYVLHGLALPLGTWVYALTAVLSMSAAVAFPFGIGPYNAAYYVWGFVPPSVWALSNNGPTPTAFASPVPFATTVAHLGLPAAAVMLRFLWMLARRLHWQVRHAERPSARLLALAALVSLALGSIGSTFSLTNFWYVPWEGVPPTVGVGWAPNIAYATWAATLLAAASVIASPHRFERSRRHDHQAIATCRN